MSAPRILNCYYLDADGPPHCRKFKGKELLLCYFGAANGRFAAMFGLWAFLYKTVHNSLRLMTPPPIGSKRRHTVPSLQSNGDDGDVSGGSGANTPRSFSSHTEEEKAKIKNKQRPVNQQNVAKRQKLISENIRVLAEKKSANNAAA